MSPDDPAGGKFRELCLDGIRAFVVDAPALSLPDALTASKRAVVELVVPQACTLLADVALRDGVLRVAVNAHELSLAGLDREPAVA